MTKVAKHSPFAFGRGLFMAIVGISVVISGNVANAQDIPSDGSSTQKRTIQGPAPATAQQSGADHSQQVPANRQAAISAAADHKAAVEARLQDAKLRVCENHEKTITSVMKRITEKSKHQFTLFNTITERTESFYTKKGHILSNYDQLVSDVAAKKAAAQAEIDAVNSVGSTFTCTGSDPKGTLSTFRSSWKSEITALQGYRTSIKNLIVAVKSAQSTSGTTQTSTKVTN
jgi:hypothetical protein